MIRKMILDREEYLARYVKIVELPIVAWVAVRRGSAVELVPIAINPTETVQRVQTDAEPLAVIPSHRKASLVVCCVDQRCRSIGVSSPEIEGVDWVRVCVSVFGDELNAKIPKDAIVVRPDTLRRALEELRMRKAPRDPATFARVERMLFRTTIDVGELVLGLIQAGYDIGDVRELLGSVGVELSDEELENEIAEMIRARTLLLPR